MSIQVYATVMVMHDYLVHFYVVTCNPRGSQGRFGAHIAMRPWWLIDLLKRAGVVFVFSDSEATALRSRGVMGVWDTQARVPRKPDGDKEPLSAVWDVTIGAALGVVSQPVEEDACTNWTRQASNWVAIHAGNPILRSAQLNRGWNQSMAAAVAILQVGLVQWHRGDSIVMVQPSADKLQLATTLREHYDEGTGPYSHCPAGYCTPRPELPTAVKACGFDPAMVMPVKPFLSVRYLHEAWLHANHGGDFPSAPPLVARPLYRGAPPPQLSVTETPAPGSDDDRHDWGAWP